MYPTLFFVFIFCREKALHRKEEFQAKTSIWISMYSFSTMSYFITACSQNYQPRIQQQFLDSKRGNRLNILVHQHEESYLDISLTYTHRDRHRHSFQCVFYSEIMCVTFPQFSINCTLFSFFFLTLLELSVLLIIYNMPKKFRFLGDLHILLLRTIKQILTPVFNLKRSVASLSQVLFCSQTKNSDMTRSLRTLALGSPLFGWFPNLPLQLSVLRMTPNLLATPHLLSLASSWPLSRLAEYVDFLPLYSSKARAVSQNHFRQRMGSFS